MAIVQSVIIDRDVFTYEESLQYLQDNDYKSDTIEDFYLDYRPVPIRKIDHSENIIRFRQEDPQELLKKGYNTYCIKYIKEGVELIVAFKKSNSYNYI
jgi:hypothetical protein